MVDHRVPPLDDQTVLAQAADAGFRLVQCETDTGQLLWEWRRGDEPKPQFVTRRVAIHWMAEFLLREQQAFDPSHGRSYAERFSGGPYDQLEVPDETTAHSPTE